MTLLEATLESGARFRPTRRSSAEGYISSAIRARPDLGYILSSHDLPLVEWLSPKQIIHVRDSQVISAQPEQRTYDIHVLRSEDGISDELKSSILGSRKRLLFVEGEETSEDRSLYGHTYQDWNIVAKGGWETVVNAVRALRDNSEYAWLEIYGLIDKDGRNLQEIEKLALDGINSISVPTIENLFCLEEVMRHMVVAIHKFQGGLTPTDRMRAASELAPSLFQHHRDDIVYRRVTWTINRMLSERKVSVKSLSAGQNTIDSIDIGSITAAEAAQVDALLQIGDVSRLLKELPIKNTSIPARLVAALGFETFAKYKGAMLRQIELKSEEGLAILELVRGQLPALAVI